jgi:hypothetical protein
MRDTAYCAADFVIDRQRQVSPCGTTRIPQAGDGLRLARVVGLMSFPKNGKLFSCRHGHSGLCHLFCDFGKRIFVRFFYGFLFHGFMMSRGPTDSSSIRIMYGLDFPELSNSETGGKLFQWHGNWYGLKIAHLRHGDAVRATGSSPILPSRLLISHREK